MPDLTAHRTVVLDLDPPIWERFFTVAPLVVVGTREPDGGDDLAPKHLAMPLSWRNHVGFVCTPRHRTYQNIARERSFAVSYVRPSQAVLASLAASPRCGDGSKPVAAALPTFAASQVQGAFLQDGYLFLECELERFVDDIDDNALIIGRIVAASAAEDALRSADRDDEDLLLHAPLLAYLHPGRFAEIASTNVMPFPAGFKR
jgi:flavin reductase (DIM6/NTAB) family NADH-FMN oxidoreductase RutF